MSGNIMKRRFRKITIPERITIVINKAKITNKYCEFEELLYNDSFEAKELFEIKKLIKEICSYCDNESFPIVIDEFKTVIQTYRVKKKEELQFDKGSEHLVDINPNRSGGANKVVKVGTREVTRKLNLIDEVEKFIIDYSKQEPLFKENYECKNMFVASKTKRKFSDYDLKEIKSYTKDNKKHKYELHNGNVYHEETGKLLREKKPDNTDFILQLIGMYVLDVKKFLNYQYSNSNNKTDLFTFIKYGVLNSKTIKHEGTKEQIKDWVQEIENNELSIQESAAQPDREEKTEEQKETLTSTIEKHFKFLNNNCPRKHKQILLDEDYNKLIKWTEYYYQNKFKLPSITKPINRVETNKSYIQLAFKYLFKEINKSSTMPDSLFELYRQSFSKYNNDKKENFFKVKNNDDVKKLMNIDY